MTQPPQPAGIGPPTPAVSAATRAPVEPDRTSGDGSPGAASAAPSGPRYLLGEEMARGGMGVVYRATDSTLAREVAVKGLHERFAPDSGTARRFGDEARITGQLQHPGIPPVHDVGALPDGRPFLAMKLIKGSTLDVLLAARHGPSHERGRFVAVFEQVDQAVPLARRRRLLETAAAVQPAELGLLMALAGTYPLNTWEGSEQRLRWCQAAVAAAPSNAAAHNDLGIVLYDRKDMIGAEAAFREAIRLDSRYANAHNGLGLVLYERWDLSAAEAACRQAIRLAPRLALAHNNLGNVLYDRGNLDGAIAAYKRALQIEPKHPYALHNLPRAERMRDLLPRLPAVLAGKEAAKTPAEACDFALLCAQPFLKRFASAARLYEQGFAADVRLAADLAAWHRYNAAWSAAQAARGNGVGAPAAQVERAALRSKGAVAEALGRGEGGPGRGAQTAPAAGAPAAARGGAAVGTLGSRPASRLATADSLTA